MGKLQAAVGGGFSYVTVTTGGKKFWEEEKKGRASRKKGKVANTKRTTKPARGTQGENSHRS